MKLLVVMDDITRINVEKDTTIALLLEAQRRSIECYYTTSLFFINAHVQCYAQKIEVRDVLTDFYTLHKVVVKDIATFNIILMRKDPPFNLSYLYLTHLLDYAVANGVQVVNHPQGLRDANEKIAATWFSDCSVPTVVTNNINTLDVFFQQQKDIVCKPLDAMGGANVHRVQQASQLSAVFSFYNGEFFMAQRYIPDVVYGDKRVLLIHGEPMPFGLLRVPQAGKLTANLATGGRGVVSPLTEAEHAVCARVKNALTQKGLVFVGLDMIGGYLTEVNVTSPTCVREIERETQLNYCAMFFEGLRKS